MIVWLNAWPMCSVPVTFGGGSWMRNRAGRVECRRGIAAFFPLRAPLGLDGGGSKLLASVLSLMVGNLRKMRELDAESDNYKWMHIGQPSQRRGTRACSPGAARGSWRALVPS
jgi:hypothetical protein